MKKAGTAKRFMPKNIITDKKNLFITVQPEAYILPQTCKNNKNI